MKLTALQVKNAKPGSHSDGKGLILLVKPSGAKSWVLRAQANGKRRDYGLGPVDLVSLQEAREKAVEGRKMIRAGFDPSMEWKRARRVLPTFEAAARQYHSNVKAGWKNGKHNAQWLSTLESHAFPVIGNETVDRIEASHIESVLQPIWMTIPETARRVRQRIGSVLDYAHGQGWRSTEAPMRAVQSLMKGLKQPRKGNFAAMPYSEVPSFVAKLREAGPSIGRSALEFLILTAARSGEVRGAKWGEIDTGKLQWNVPAARMKMGESHSVPLTLRAVAILKDMQSHSRGEPGDLIFPGQRRQPLSDMTLGKALKTIDGRAFTVHGFRSSFRDWAAEKTTFPNDWAEAALAHGLSNRVEAAYKRTKFLDQRRALMDAWAAFLLTDSY